MGVELVRDPGRVVPGPPDDEQAERRVPGAAPAQVVEQQVRDLRDREDEDEVVEELERGCPLLLTRVARSLESRHRRSVRTRRNRAPSGGVLGHGTPNRRRTRSRPCRGCGRRRLRVRCRRHAGGGRRVPRDNPENGRATRRRDDRSRVQLRQRADPRHLGWPRGVLPAGVLPDGGSYATILPNGRIWTKIGWWRGLPGKLVITGRRIDAPAPALRAEVPRGYGTTGFVPAGFVFPTVGCRRVDGNSRARR